MDVELQQLLTGGSIGGVRLGMSKQEVFQLRGEPAYWECKPQSLLMNSDLWVYRDLQVVFDWGVVSVLNLCIGTQSILNAESDYESKSQVPELISKSPESFAMMLEELGIRFEETIAKNRQPEFRLGSNVSAIFARQSADIGISVPAVPQLVLIRHSAVQK